MRAERRGPTLRLRMAVNQRWEEPVSEAKPRRLEGKSRMRREFHVRFCEGGGVKFPSATRLMSSLVHVLVIQGFWNAWPPY